MEAASLLDKVVIRYLLDRCLKSVHRDFPALNPTVGSDRSTAMDKVDFEYRADTSHNQIPLDCRKYC